MLSWGLNHMTLRHAGVLELLDVAARLGCTGVELRNDLSEPLFGGLSGAHVGEAGRARGLNVLALAEVYGFNGNEVDRVRAEVENLCAQAKSCDSASIVLIPEIADSPIDRKDQIARLRIALETVRPIIEDAGVVALIEPLGFANSSLRFKEDAVGVLNGLGRPACFGLVHDTFHHHLAGGTGVFADLTRVVHISGVHDFDCTDDALTDAHRGLVGSKDRLENIQQIKDLRSNGYKGAFSFEAFSPHVQSLDDPVEAIGQSMEFIASKLGIAFAV